MSHIDGLSGLTRIILSALIIALSGCVSQSTPTPTAVPRTIAPTDSPPTAIPPMVALPTPTTVPAPAIRTELGSIDEPVDQQIQALMDEGDIPSLSVGIVLNDELVWAKNYDGPAGLDTVYIVGSIQKPFTASAVLQLVERGLLDLDEDVSAYVRFPVKHPEHPETPITIRMLLTHQSGLGDTTAYLDLYRHRGDYSVYEFGEELLGIEFPRIDPYPSNETFYEGLLAPDGIYYTPDVWEAKPGTVYYSNIGYELLGYIVERVTGQPFAAYLGDHILDPLEMTHSGYKVSDLIQYHALPYERMEGGYFVMEGEKVPILEGSKELVENNLLELPLYEHAPGAGGLRTTVLDLAQFMIAHMNQGLAPNGFQVLQPETAEMMHQSAGSTEGNINSFNLVGQGMGWSLCEDGVEGHVGGQYGFGGTMVFKQTPNGTNGILLMTNVGAMYVEDGPRFDWFNRYYFQLEQLLFQAAEEMLARKSKS